MVGLLEFKKKINVINGDSMMLQVWFQNRRSRMRRQEKRRLEKEKSVSGSSAAPAPKRARLEQVDTCRKSVAAQSVASFAAPNAQQYYAHPTSAISRAYIGTSLLCDWPKPMKQLLHTVCSFSVGTGSYLLLNRTYSWELANKVLEVH